MSEHASEPSARRIAIPAAVTLASLFCGLLSMSLAETMPYSASCAIVVAGVFDMADGRVARVFNARSSFGAQLDSLVDVVSFGVAPAWLVYVWVLAAPAGDAVPWLDPWLALPFAFAACAAVRLARFNVEDARTDGPTKVFGGLPAPAGALVVTTVIMASHELGIEELRSRTVMAPVVVIAAALMVSQIPLPSYKTFPNRVMQATYYGLLVLGLTMLVLGLPGGTLLLAFVVYYALSGVITGLRGRSPEAATAQSGGHPDPWA